MQQERFWSELPVGQRSVHEPSHAPVKRMHHMQDHVFTEVGPEMPEMDACSAYHFKHQSRMRQQEQTQWGSKKTPPRMPRSPRQVRQQDTYNEPRVDYTSTYGMDELASIHVDNSQMDAPPGASIDEYEQPWWLQPNMYQGNPIHPKSERSGLRTLQTGPTGASFQGKPHMSPRRPAWNASSIVSSRKVKLREQVSGIYLRTPTKCKFSRILLCRYFIRFVFCFRLTRVVTTLCSSSAQWMAHHYHPRTYHPPLRMKYL